MSPKSINKILDQIGSEHDDKLATWKTNIQEYFVKIKSQQLELANLLSHKLTLEEGNQLQELEKCKLDINKCEKTIQDVKMNRPHSYSIVLDNFDLMVHAADMTSDNQNRDNHWCNHNAVLDRVNPTEGTCTPRRNLKDTPNSTFIPNLEEQAAIVNDLVIIISRVLVENIKEFEAFKSVVPSHFKHKYSKELSKKSEKACIACIAWVSIDLQVH